MYLTKHILVEKSEGVYNNMETRAPPHDLKEHARFPLTRTRSRAHASIMTRKGCSNTYNTCRSL